MNIGQLTKDNNGVFMGRIATQTIDAQIGLREVKSTNSAAPRFDVMLKGKSGAWNAQGALWAKQAANGSGEFLQGQIDDPSFDDTLYIAGFAQEDGSINIVWSRPRQQGPRSVFTAGSDEQFSPRQEEFAGASGNGFDDADGSFQS